MSQGSRMNGSFFRVCRWWPFCSMCKESLEVGSFFFFFLFPALPAKLSGLSTGKVWLVIGNKNEKLPWDLDLKQSNNPTSAKFSDCNQVRRSCRLLGEAAVDVGETGHGQDNKRSAGGVGVGLCVEWGEDARRLWPQSDKTLWDLCEKESKNRDKKKGCCSLPFYQLSVAKVSLHNSLETRVLIRQESTMNLPLDNPWTMDNKTKVYCRYNSFKPLNT